MTPARLLVSIHYFPFTGYVSPDNSLVVNIKLSDRTPVGLKPILHSSFRCLQLVKLLRKLGVSTPLLFFEVGTRGRELDVHLDVPPTINAESSFQFLNHQ